MNTTAAPVVSLLMKEEPPEPPNRVCEAPPKAAPISAPFPVWSRTIAISAIEAITWTKMISRFMIPVPFS